MNKDQIRNQLQSFRTEAELQAWFDPLRLRFTESGSLEISFPHPLFARWFTKERQREFERDVLRVVGGQLRFVYARSLPGQSAQVRTKKISVAPPKGFSDKYSFETFIYNRKNDFPVSMARELAASAKNPAYIPFTIYGGEGCGKSHLLRATAVAMSATVPWESIFFGTAADLAAGFEEGKPGSFKRRISRCKAVFIDNLQDISRHKGLEQELVSLADLFRDRRKPLVFALDQGFDRETFGRNFRSHLESGLAVALAGPDLDIRLRYAKAECTAQRLHLRKELLLPLAQRFRNLRAIQGVVRKIAAYQNRSGKPLTMGDLEKILSHETLSGKPASLSAIISHVAEAFSLAPEDITGNSRAADIVFARQVAMYLCRELMGVTSSALGQYFNGKNHATVLYACKKISKIMESDKDTHKLVTSIRKKFLTRNM